MHQYGLTWDIYENLGKRSLKATMHAYALCLNE